MSLSFLPCRTPFDERCRGRGRNRTNQKVTQVARLAERTVSPSLSHPLVNQPRESNAGGIVVSSPMTVGQCQRPPVQPYRGSDCNGPGADSTRLLCHLGCFKCRKPSAGVVAACSEEGGLSRTAQAVLPNRLMNAPRKPFTGPEPGRPGMTLEDLAG